jgi:Nuclear RNA export factor, NTF2 domain
LLLFFPPTPPPSLPGANLGCVFLFFFWLSMSGDGGGRRQSGGDASSAAGTWVEVTGFDPSGTNFDGLKKFLVTGAATPVQIGQHVSRGRKAFMLVTSGDASALVRQSGRRMGPQKLLVRLAHNFKDESTSGGKKAEQRVDQTLQQFLSDAFNRQTGVLDCSGTGNQQAPSGLILDYNNIDFMRSLWQTLQRHLGGGGGGGSDRGSKRGSRRGGGASQSRSLTPPSTMVFNSCGIHTLAGFGLLREYELGGVANFSFDSNLLSSFDELGRLQRGLDQHGNALKELVLTNNPTMASVTAEQYHQEVQRRFRKIAYLDGVAVEPIVNFGVPALSARIPDLLGDVADSEMTQTMAATFVSKFFEVYDSGDRNSLLDVYSDRSCFSVVADFKSKPRKGQRRQSGADQEPEVADLGPYAEHDRNLKHDSETKAPRLKEGRANIVACFNTLPATKVSTPHKLGWFFVCVYVIPPLTHNRFPQHDLENLVVDAALVNLPVREDEGTGQLSEQGSLVVHVHGELTETSTTGAYNEETASIQRDFTRSFVLFPMPETSPARAAGWEVQILNDSLTVRNATSEGHAFKMHAAPALQEVAAAEGTLTAQDYLAVTNPAAAVVGVVGAAAMPLGGVVPSAALQQGAADGTLAAQDYLVANPALAGVAAPPGQQVYGYGM